MKYIYFFSVTETDFIKNEQKTNHTELLSIEAIF